MIKHFDSGKLSGDFCPRCRQAQIYFTKRLDGTAFADCPDRKTCRGKGRQTAAVEDDAIEPIASSAESPPVASDAASEAFYGLVKARVEAHVAAEMARLEIWAPRIVEYRVNDIKLAQADGHRHAAYATCIEKIAYGFINFMLVGPSGGGKTTLVRGLAKDLSLTYALQPCSGGISETVFTGRMALDVQSGTYRLVRSRFADLYENGGVFLADEMDAADDNILLVINAALDNGHFTLADGSEIERHSKFYFFAGCNTWGHGADRTYVGRNQLDGATLDRFVGAKISVDYDRELETALTADLPTLRGEFWTVRDRITAIGLRKIWSTRGLVAAARMVRGGKNVTDALRDLAEGWTQDEKSKAGVV